MHLVYKGLVHKVSIANLTLQNIKFALILRRHSNTRQILSLISCLGQAWKQTGIFKRISNGIIWVIYQLLLVIILYARNVFRLIEHDFIGEIIYIFELACLFPVSPWDSALTQFMLKGSSHLAHSYTCYSCWRRIYIDSHYGRSCMIIK